MQRVTVTDMLVSLGWSGSETVWQPLRRLAMVTALKQTPAGRFHDGHWWRGPLLYALVRQHRPVAILEIGTGRGYGALCMAKALSDGALDGTIWTIDQMAPTAVQPWALDEGTGPMVRSLALQDVWEAHVPEAWRQRVRCLTGDSAAVMKGWLDGRRPRIELAFIDAAHDYWMVKRDLLAVLQVAAPECTIVLDDYTPRAGYGIQRLVDEEVAPRLPDGTVTVVDLLAKDYTAGGGEVAHAMALIDGKALAAGLSAQLYSPGEISRFLSLHTARIFGAHAARYLKTAVRGCLSPQRIARNHANVSSR